MPPRKSDASRIATGDEAAPVVRDGINIDDYSLPKSIVTRLAKGVLPPNTQVQANAMLAMTKSATVFVNYLASHANEYAAQSNRKTINPQDVFSALKQLEFPEFTERLEAELAKFNENQLEKRNAYKNKVASSKAGGQTEAEGDVDMDKGGSQPEREGPPVAKKARIDPDESEVVDGDQTEEEIEEEQGDDPEDEEEEDEEQEDAEPEEALEDHETKEVEDEALDNGDDSD